MQNNQYDYIIAGMGCAGLSLALRLKQSEIPFTKVLIIDKVQKNTNDRTWCFWTKSKNNWFDDIIYKKWNQLMFKSKNLELSFEIKPYEYCLIRGIDFYDFCFKQLRLDSRFEFITDEINSIFSDTNSATLKTTSNTYVSKLIFNSAFRNQKIEKHHVNFVQHFKGCLIEFEMEVINDTIPVFMDFNVDQNNDCRFIYLIPYSKTKALIEYTGFSKNACTEQEYDDAIKNYLIKNFFKLSYKILETEKGQIPMHESKFINPFGKRVINIGTAGGDSKASSGYTFYFIQKSVEEIIKQLKVNPEKVLLKEKQKRYHYFDSVLLQVLNQKQIEAAKVFESLFKNNNIIDVLEFLNEESSLAQDLRIISTLPKKHFIMPGIKKLINVRI